MKPVDRFSFRVDAAARVDAAVRVDAASRVDAAVRVDAASLPREKKESSIFRVRGKDAASTLDVASTRAFTRMDAKETAARLRPVFFECTRSVSKCSGGNLPHWQQGNCCVFVTWRTADSLPVEKLASLRNEQDQWKLLHPEFFSKDAASRVDAAVRVDAASLPREKKESSIFRVRGKDAASTLGCASTNSAQLWTEYRDLFFGRVQEWLDAGYGACPLKDERARGIVEDAILHFNGIRYVVYAYVVMPNHVHVLFMPLGGLSFSDILHTWKSYSATIVNRQFAFAGAFWQKESWDHLVRNERQFAKYVKYIIANDPDYAWSAYDA